MVVLMLGAASAQEEGSLTISFPGDPRSETVNALIDDFVAMKAEQGVTVDVTINEPTEGYVDQLLLDFSAGVGPDVFSISAESIPEFVTADLIMPLDDLLAEWDEWENFPDGMQQMPSLNGVTYAIMYNTDARVLFCGRVEQAGIALPFEPKTPDDIFAADQVGQWTISMEWSRAIWGRHDH
jgi:ABC-type glycerol-3-phosphate transport system substrate-binding protein